MANILGTVGLPSGSGTFRPTRLPPASGLIAGNRQPNLGRLVASLLQFLFKFNNLVLCSLQLFFQPCNLCIGICGTRDRLNRRADSFDDCRHLYSSNDFSFLDLGVARSNLGEVVGAENADRVDDNRKRDHELEGGSEELTGLEGDTTDDNDRLGDPLGTEGGDEGGDDAIREGGKEAGDHRPEVERSREDDDVLGVEHFV